MNTVTTTSFAFSPGMNTSLCAVLATLSTSRDYSLLPKPIVTAKAPRTALHHMHALFVFFPSIHLFIYAQICLLCFLQLSHFPMTFWPPQPLPPTPLVSLSKAVWTLEAQIIPNTVTAPHPTESFQTCNCFDSPFPKKDPVELTKSEDYDGTAQPTHSKRLQICAFYSSLRKFS